uniref:Uncharacterized protein n=1 Tax=Marseillevirus LCMAC101 TaxID=2506602 RepID=A0A481YT32_9VIRU|nr:MAG: hypothetical protein LCMAC101_02410 [Marseillevirus LCMAC101]
MGIFRFITSFNIYVHGHYLTVLVYKHRYDRNYQQHYLIGYQVANSLGRRTSNLYRCLRDRGITLDTLSEQKIKELISNGTLIQGANSITLIPYDEGRKYIEQCEMNEIEEAANILIRMSKKLI